MPFPIKVKVSWLKTQSLKMAGFAHGTVTKMTDNTNFPSPAIDLTVIDAAASRVETAWANRKNGQSAKDELTNAQNDLNAKLHTQANYVTQTAAGNVTIIHSGGWESTKSDKTPSTIPNATNTPVITSLSGGGIKSKVLTISGATTYTHILVIDGDFNVTIQNGIITVPAGTIAYIITGGKTTEIFPGLTPLKKVYVAVIANNAAGSSSLSPVASASTNL